MTKNRRRPWESVARGDDKLISRAFSRDALTYDCFETKTEKEEKK